MPFPLHEQNIGSSMTANKIMLLSLFICNIMIEYQHMAHRYEFANGPPVRPAIGNETVLNIEYAECANFVVHNKPNSLCGKIA